MLNCWIKDKNLIAFKSNTLVKSWWSPDREGRENGIKSINQSKASQETVETLFLIICLTGNSQVLPSREFTICHLAMSYSCLFSHESAYILGDVIYSQRLLLVGSSYSFLLDEKTPSAMFFSGVIMFFKHYVLATSQNKRMAMPASYGLRLS